MGQQHTIGKRSTSVRGNMKDGFLSVIYHATEVVLVKNGKVRLNTGGWETSTTKTRMNQASNQFSLNFRVFQRDFVWLVEKPDGEVIPFHVDGTAYFTL